MEIFHCKMVLEDMSWHLRYYEYSYMYYILGSAFLCLAYTIIYCVKERYLCNVLTWRRGRELPN